MAPFIYKLENIPSKNVLGLNIKYSPDQPSSMLWYLLYRVYQPNNSISHMTQLF